MKRHRPARRPTLAVVRAATVALVVALPLGGIRAAPVAATTPDVDGAELLCIENGDIGWLEVQVQMAACEAEDVGERPERFPAACDGYPPEAVSDMNANPVRLVVQVRSPRPFDTLGPASFTLATQFGPTPDAELAALSCNDCFEVRSGGTYALWLVPNSETWIPGSYFLRVGIVDEPGILAAPVRIDVPVGTPNEPPTASIVTIPEGAQQLGFPAIFDGSRSSDPDGRITCYQWTIDSNVDDSDELVQGRGTSFLQRTYDEEQALTVLLRVSDSRIAGQECDPAGPPVAEDRFSGNVASVSYRITCGNDPPVADAGPDLAQGFSREVNPHPTWTFQLDGSRSHDPDGNIVVYRWTCGNGLPPVTAGQPPGVAFCRYFGFGEWTATLDVCDDGNGVVVNGQYECQKCDSDSTRIRIVDTDESGMQ